MKRKITSKIVAPPSIESIINNEKKRLLETPAILIAEPTQTFEIGQSVKIGNLRNCVVREVFADGKALVVNYGDSVGAWWWFDCINEHNGIESKFLRQQIRGQISNSSIDSLIHMYSHDGFVCNHEYQRGYVWTPSDQEALIDSIFNRMTIGAFIFVRNHGYLHNENSGTVRYLTLHGTEVEIRKCDNFTNEIIDGQQRLTTLMMFILGKISYRGYKFQELPYEDKRGFLTTSISYRIIEEEQITRKERLELFLQVNRGVPQDASHLAKVQKLFNAIQDE